MFRKLLLVIGVLTLLLGGLVAYAALTTDKRLQFPDTPLPALVASKNPEVIAQGKYLAYGPAHCSHCHSHSEHDHYENAKSAPLQGGMKFALGPLGTRYASNLTQLGSLSDAMIARTLKTGVMHTGELSFFMRVGAAELSDEDVVALLSYLRSLAPVKNDVPQGEWYLFGKMLITYAFPPLRPRTQTPAHVPPSAQPSLARGEYLARHVAMCVGCHSGQAEGSWGPALPLGGGGTAEPSHGLHDQDMEYIEPNLTSHPTGITGKMTEDAFVARMHAGRVFPSSIMPWEAAQATTESDLRSIYRYLKSLPAADNDVGLTYRKKS